MTALDHLTAAFESLWETKVHLLNAQESAPAESQPQLQRAFADVAAIRDRLEVMLVELQARSPSAPPSP